mmetsp:Transcript_61023/g.176722  ORF Transcript_61023/g.176722 Transcript_61023/m.176722 type:complete len:213 (-) Transcript_61023:269-907(-)
MFALVLAEALEADLEAAGAPCGVSAILACESLVSTGLRSDPRPAQSAPRRGHLRVKQGVLMYSGQFDALGLCQDIHQPFQQSELKVHAEHQCGQAHRFQIAEVPFNQHLYTCIGRLCSDGQEAQRHDQVPHPLAVLRSLAVVAQSIQLGLGLRRPGGNRRRRRPRRVERRRRSQSPAFGEGHFQGPRVTRAACRSFGARTPPKQTRKRCAGS